MNLLEHYIKDIIKEEKVERDGVVYYRVELIIDCYGTEHRTEIFPEIEWETAKKLGYYMG